MTSFFHLFIRTWVSEEIEKQHQLYLFTTHISFNYRVNLMMLFVNDDVIVTTSFLQYMHRKLKRHCFLSILAINFTKLLVFSNLSVVNIGYF